MDEELRRALEVVRARLSGDETAPRVKVRELWDEWEPWAERNRADWSVKRSHKRLVLDTEIILHGRTTCLGDLHWHECDVTAADAWRATFQALVSSHGRIYAAGTRNSMLMTLRACFKWHVTRRRIPRNPLKGAPNEEENRRVGYLTEETTDEFAGAMSSMCSLILRLSFATGMRNGEARELRRSEVVQSEALIVIPGWRTKSGRPKVIPVPDDIWPELLAQVDRVVGEFVFPSPRKPKQPIGKTGFHYWVVKAREKTGMVLPGGEAPTPHHARHGFSIRFLAEGGTTAQAMAIMGHKTMPTALRYQRLVGPALEKAREVMARKGPKALMPTLSYEVVTKRR